ncbi:MAG: helix-turn-helix domain-containing protein [Ilumatobacteraceae bacterium]
MRTALSVFESIARDQPVGLTEIATDLALPVTTVHRALGTLADAGWVRQVLPGRRWVVSDHIEHVVGRRFAMLADRVRPALTELRTRTGESTMYAVADGDHMVVVVAVDSDQALRVVASEGSRHPLHRLSTGKAVLAAWADGDVRAYAARCGLDASELLAECAATRIAGHAVNLGGWEPGVGSISVAVTAAGVAASAGVGVFGPIDRFEGRGDTIAGLVRHAARRLTADIATGLADGIHATTEPNAHTTRGIA